MDAYLKTAGVDAAAWKHDNAQSIAAHESPRTTKLYDRTCDQISLSEVERIGIRGCLDRYPPK